MILPGVEIQVVKEIITGQLNPSGILGLVGITENKIDGRPRNTGRASSFKELKGLFGRSIDQTVPEAKQAFQNGVDEVVMVPVIGSTLNPAMVELKGKSGETVFKLTARAPGLWGNGISVKLETKKDDTGKRFMCKVTLKTPNSVEVFSNLYLDPEHERFFCNVVNRESELVVAVAPRSSGKTGKNKKGADKKVGDSTPELESGNPVGLKEMPVEMDTTLSGGATATKNDYEDAIVKLESEDDVDIVIASIEEYSDTELIKHVHSVIEAHCRVMSENCMNRIGFGTVPI